MSTYEFKEGQASLFKNTQKEKENHPDFKGKAMIEGKMYYLSFWSKKTDGGNVWLSGNVQQADKSKPVTDTEADEFMQPTALKVPETSIEVRPDDDLPF